MYDNAEIASTMGLVAFSLMLVVAAFETRDEKASILRVETFDNRTLNITALVEIALALLIARGGALTSLLGTAALSSAQWLIGALPALVLFIVWELGKAIARRFEQAASRRRCPQTSATAGDNVQLRFPCGHVGTAGTGTSRRGRVTADPASVRMTACNSPRCMRTGSPGSPRAPPTSTSPIPCRNAASVVDVSRRLSETGVAVAVFPELTLTGYAIDDLLGQDAVLDAVHEGLAAIVAGQRRTCCR